MTVTNDSSAACPCGRPLHYTDPMIREIFEDRVRRLGPEITVSVIGDPRGSASRSTTSHYMASRPLICGVAPGGDREGRVRGPVSFDGTKIVARTPEQLVGPLNAAETLNAPAELFLLGDETLIDRSPRLPCRSGARVQPRRG